MFPQGLVYDRKNEVFRTPEVNSIIAEIARQKGNSEKKEREPITVFDDKSPSAGYRLQCSNLLSQFTKDLAKIHSFCQTHKTL